MTHTFSDNEDIAAGLGSMGLRERPSSPWLDFRKRDDIVQQKALFDYCFGKLSRETEVIYSGYQLLLPLKQCQKNFHNDCLKGHMEITFGNLHLKLIFGNASPIYPGECDFVKEPGKVHLCSHFKLDGIFVVWRGWIDLERLAGVGRLEYDKERAVKNVCDMVEVYNSVMAARHPLDVLYNPLFLSRRYTPDQLPSS